MGFFFLRRGGATQNYVDAHKKTNVGNVISTVMRHNAQLLESISIVSFIFLVQ